MAITYYKAPNAPDAGEEYGEPFGTCPVEMSFKGKPDLQKKVCLGGAFILTGVPVADYTCVGMLKTLSNTTGNIFTSTNTIPSTSVSNKWKFRHRGLVSLNRINDFEGETVLIGLKKYKNAVQTGGKIDTEQLPNGRVMLKLGYHYKIFGTFEEGA